MYGIERSFIDDLKNDDMRKTLQQFINFASEKVHYFDGKTVTYMVAGSGDRTLLILPGTTGRAVAYFEHIMSLASDFRIVCVNYPVIDSISAVASAVKEIMSFEGIDEYFVFAHSVGGVIAQELLKVEGSNIRGVIIAHSYAKTPNVPKAACEWHYKNNRKMVRSSRSFRYRFFRNGFAKRVVSGITSADISNKEFWSKFYREIFMNTSIEEIQSFYGMLCEFWKGEPCTNEIFRDWKGRTLIIESEIDKGRKMPEKESLLSVFEGAETFELSGSSNLSIVKNKEQLLEKVANFMKRS